MEPVNGMSGDQSAHATAEHEEDQAGASGLNDQTPEPFEASIVRLDQAAAEEIFRRAIR